MMQKPWFKTFIWFMAIFFFFLASGVIISLFSPGPSESDVMKFMSGMMSAMDRSLMGVAMGIENDESLKSVVVLSSAMLVPIIIISIAAGFIIRVRQKGGKNV